jgi:hypothetical protein
MRWSIRIGFGIALAVAALAFTLIPAERSAEATIVYLVDADPNSATNIVNSDHTVTATATDSISGNPLPGYEVTFDVTSGPNTGVGGQVTTDANGQATFTYTGSGGTGVDSIDVCLFLPLLTRPAQGLQAPLDCDTVTKEWINPTPTASPSPTLAPTTQPTSTPTLAPIAQLPGGGGQATDGGAVLPWAVVAVFAGVVLSGIAIVAALRRAG